MAESVNWIFIVLGFALGCPAGFIACQMHISAKQHRSHLRKAAPALRSIGFTLGGIVALGFVGLIALGVL